jgi:hypothetical protein
MSDFGLGTEFNDLDLPAVEPGKEPAASDEPKKFVKEIDLGDGSGVQKFEADSEAELIDKLVEAQTNATKEIRKLQRAKPRARPQKRERVVEAQRPYAEPIQVSAQDDLDFATGLSVNPSKVIGRLFEASTGIKLDDLRATKEKVGEMVSQMEEQTQAQAFINSTPEFKPSKANSDALLGILEDEELPVTQQNLSYAYQQAMDGALLELPAAPKPEPKPQAKETVTKVKRTQTALSAADTGQKPVPAAEQAGALPDVNKLLEGDLETARERIVREMARQRQPAA